MQAFEVEGLNIRGYEEVFSSSQNRLSYLLATSMPNFNRLRNYPNALFKDN